MSEKLSESIDWKLTEALFDQPVILVVGALVPAGVAAIGFWRTGQTWFVGLAVIALIVLGMRVGVHFAFGRRRLRRGGTARWRRWFFCGASMNGAVCGLGAAGSVLFADAFTQMLIITSLTGFVMSSAARNSSYPKAAVGSVVLGEGPLILACFATGQTYFLAGAFLSFLFMISALSIVRHFYAQTVRFLVTDEKNALLMSESRRANIELAAANEKLALMAGTDSLTGVPNRRSFELALVKEARSAHRDGSEMSLLMFDIDLFKQYNDTYGHQAGDTCLRQVAQALTKHARRPRDLVARYGGEEFVAILPLTNRTASMQLAESFRAGVESLGVTHSGGAIGVVTVSVGVATLCGGSGEAAEAALRRADAALYRAKGAGRNRAEAAPLEPPAIKTRSAKTRRITERARFAGVG